MQKSKFKTTIQNLKLFKFVQPKAGYKTFAFCLLPFELKRGFSLMEMLIAVAIFSTTVVGVIGVMLTILNVQRRTAEVQAVIDNVRFGTELMTKELRTGTEYQLTNAYGCAPASSAISFISATDGNGRIYFIGSGANSGIIMRAVLTVSPPQTLNPLTDCDGVADLNSSEAIPLTSPDVNVTSLRFRISGAVLGPNDGQPFITISVRAQGRDQKILQQTSMNIQTSVVQRIRDQ